jgi:transporter family protein
MQTWLTFALAAISLWGFVGLLQKLGADRISAHSLLVWVTLGFLLTAPFYLPGSGVSSLSLHDIGWGLLVGITNGLGSWALFSALERGAKASVAVPLTALYPLVTLLLAIAFLGESLTPRQWLGVACAIAAAALLSHETDPQLERGS